MLHSSIYRRESVIIQEDYDYFQSSSSTSPEDTSSEDNLDDEKTPLRPPSPKMTKDGIKNPFTRPFPLMLFLKTFWRIRIDLGVTSTIHRR